jgi:hypothetical protein
MNQKILIIGDVAIDHLYSTNPQKDKGDNWQLYPALQTTLMGGGTYILGRFTEETVKNIGITAEIYRQKLPQDLGGPEARNMIQAKVLLGRFPGEDKKGNIRVQQFYGYSAPGDKTPVMPALGVNSGDVDLLVLDDAGNGFREQEEDFPQAIDSESTLVVYKMSRPLVKGKLWDKVSTRKGDWVLIVRANDLRLCSNVHVSKSLSWERTAMEMAFQLKRNPSLSELQKAPYLIILFSNDGALLVSRDPNEKSLLIFDTENLESGFASSIKGFGFSKGSAFTASLCATLLKNGPGGLVNGIKEGLSSMRNLLKQGFVAKGEELDYPMDKIFKGEKYHFSECALPDIHDLNRADPYFWRILDEKTKLSKPLATVDIVKNKMPVILGEIPVGKYGKLQTFDRSEVEQFSAIRNLILEYLDDPRTSHPLCIAVFGPPGSGKSFGVKQVLGSLGRGDIPTMTFNISQYATYNDLISDFHKVRDKVLTGVVPVAFFDEFDSDKDYRQLGWLKYFLSPMQDGEFKEGDTIHPIGKSIFVFAGGTRSSFYEFEHNIGSDVSKNKQLTDIEISKEQVKRMEQFREAKGPDFVSRLRGFINILGPNPNHQGGKVDMTFMIRRAKILRETFAMTQKTQQLFNSAGELQIDNSVLRAMLNIPDYRHGNRSINALLDMSRLTGKKKFDLSALPTPEQLNMHVDERLFVWLSSGERFYTLLSAEERFDPDHLSPMQWENELIDKVAEKIHEDYCRQRQIQKQNSPTAVSWVDLPESKKKSNLDAAAGIPEKLSIIGHGIRKIKGDETLTTPDISDEEIERLARYEHQRWCHELVIQGWKYHLKRDDAGKLHPNIVPWEELPDSEKDKDFEAVYAIPRILKEAGFIIYRMEAYDIIDENLISKIAMAIHEDYCNKRKAEGQTNDTNPNLVAFNQLSDDIREANFDSARTIPRKMKLLNIVLQKAMSGTRPELLVLTKDEIESLSRWEHARWNWQKIMQGWIWGSEKNEAIKTHPCILPWKKLTEEIKEYDRENVRLIPGFIRDSGYEAVRKK